MRLVGVREEEAEGGVGWRRMTCCGEEDLNLTKLGMRFCTLSVFGN